MYQFSSVTHSCPTLCDPMDCSTPGLPAHHQLTDLARTHVHWADLAQTHVHWAGDTIQPSHPLTFPSPPALHLSQHQDLFQWVSSLHQVAKVLEIQLTHQSFQWIFKVDFLQEQLVWFPGNPRGSQESFPVPQFESISSVVFSLFYGPAHTSIPDYWKDHSFDHTRRN